MDAAFSLMPSEARPAVRTDNTVVKAARGTVFGVVVAAGATGGIWALESGGGEVIVGFAQASSSTFLGPFIPPIPFAADITPDIDGSNITLTVLYN